MGPSRPHLPIDRQGLWSRSKAIHENPILPWTQPLTGGAQCVTVCFAALPKVVVWNAPFGLWQLLPHQKSFVSCRWCARLPSTGAPGSCVVGECVARRTGELLVSSSFGASQSDPHKSQFQTF